MKAVIDMRRCPAQQQMCKPIQVCGTNALQYVADETLPLGGKIVVDSELCDGCGACVDTCCGHAIELRE